jgi:hypothetical protein
MELEQRHFIKFLHVKGLKLGEIAMELSDIYSRDAHALPSIRYRLHQIKLGGANLQGQHVGRRPPLDDIDAEIISVLWKFLFSSVRTIAYSLNISASMTHTHLVEKIDLKIFYIVRLPTH